MNKDGAARREPVPWCRSRPPDRDTSRRPDGRCTRTVVRSCEMKRYARPSRFERSISRRMISAVVSGVSAEVGSSSTMKSGPVAIARAIAIRCWRPALSWRGEAFLIDGSSPTRVEQFVDASRFLLRHAAGVQIEHFADHIRDAPARIHRVEWVLEYDLQLRRAGGAIRHPKSECNGVSPKKISPPVGASSRKQAAADRCLA